MSARCKPPPPAEYTSPETVNPFVICCRSSTPMLRYAPVDGCGQLSVGDRCVAQVAGAPGRLHLRLILKYFSSLSVGGCNAVHQDFVRVVICVRGERGPARAKRASRLRHQSRLRSL